MKKGAAIFLSIESVLVTWAIFHFIIATTRLSNHLDKAWYRGRLRYRCIEMPEDFDVKQRTENIYERWKSQNNKKLSDKDSKEDGEPGIQYITRHTCAIMCYNVPQPCHTAYIGFHGI